MTSSRSSRRFGPLAASLLASCFVGDAADGLPCDVDADCGLGVSCTPDPDAGQSCCGGSCLSVQSSTGPGTTSEASTTTSSSSGSSTMATGQETDTSVCGDFVVEGEEECDDPEDGGVEDNPNCVNCRYVSACGNGMLDGDELCDPWPLNPEQTCLPGCDALVVFDWDHTMSPAQADQAFMLDKDSSLSWGLVAGLADPPMGSGSYYAGTPQAVEGLWPEAVLRTRPIVVPALVPDVVVRVEVDHDYGLNISDPNGQNNAGNATDYGVVVLEGAEAGDVLVLPTAGNPEIRCDDPDAADACVNAPVAAYCDYTSMVTDRVRQQPGFTGEPPEDGVVMSQNVLSLGSFSGGAQLQLAFRLRYDCGNYVTSPTIPAQDDAWTVQRVRVTIERAL